MQGAEQPGANLSDRTALPGLGAPWKAEPAGTFALTAERYLRSLAFAIALAAIILPPAFGSSAKAAGEADVGSDVVVAQSAGQAPAIPEKPVAKYPNLGSHLSQLAADVDGWQIPIQESAGGVAALGERSVAVSIDVTSGVEAVLGFLEQSGGDPRHVGQDYIEAYVPVGILGQVSELAGVTRVREILGAFPGQVGQRVAGHGPSVHRSPAWNRAGYSGQGVKVGIIDGGFRGWSSLMGTDLPTTVVARCYTGVGVYTQNLADCEAARDSSLGLRYPECGPAFRDRAVRNAEHGTIVAEAIADIAPGVSLYIANPRSRADMQDTVKWMASEGVEVINQSQSWILDGPGDGTSPNSTSPLRTVDLAVAHDITWVNSAGNGARNSWFGGYADPDRDRAISFAGGLNDEVLDIRVSECRTYTVQLRWEDSWDGARSDLDLYLIDKPTGRVIGLGSGRDQQSGALGDRPFEWISFLARVDSDNLGLVVFHHGGQAPDWIQLVVWGTGAIERYTGNGSITNPSESANPGLLAVGAAHWSTPDAIEPYSSLGPTPDGRIKPDIVAADCGATALELLAGNNRSFCGTSQSAPHVAGLAALVKQAFGDFSAVQVADYLKSYAIQRDSPDPNNTWGHGFAVLPAPPRGCAAYAAGLESDCRTLLGLKDTLRGSAALDWTAGRPIEGWEGVNVAGSPARVTELTLDGKGLSGRLPPELANLANLAVLSLANNQLSGEIPGKLGSLANLTALDISSNQLSGQIPTELGGLSRLNVLLLAHNRISGCIPAELAKVATNDFDRVGAFCPVPGAPAFLPGESGARTVAENTPAGMPIGAPIAATDPDDDALTYALGGSDSADFDIVAGTGQLLTKAGLDYEIKAEYTVVVTAQDLSGLSESIDIRIAVIDVNEPPILTGDAAASYAENGTDPVAIYAASDPEGEAITWLLSGNDAASFTVTGGALGFLVSPDYEVPTDADSDNVYEITVTAQDPSGLSGYIDIRITVTDVFEAIDQALLRRYDADSSGSIERSEMHAAIFDYLFGTGPNAISREQLLEVINAYLFG